MAFFQPVFNFAKNLFLGEKMETLKTKLEELSSREDDIKTELKFQASKKRKREVDLWLNRVEKLKIEVGSIEEEFAYKDRFSFLSFRSLGRLAAHKIEEVTSLLGKGRFKGGLLIDDATTPIPIPVPVHGQRTPPLLELMACLKDDTVGMIGIYGMGGIGKTTILKSAHNAVLKSYSDQFDSVFWVDVSADSGIHKLQRDISRALNLDLSKIEDGTVRAARLHAVLARKRRLLILLDDVWNPISLEDVGIPSPGAANGCKLVITTRSLEVCRRMGCQANVKVETLSEEESWNLFVSSAGLDAVCDPAVEDTARLLCKECHGLPLAIVTVARSMRGVHDSKLWRNALHKLRGPALGNEIFPVLKFSYYRLKDANLQNCFLYCALFPEDFSISREELIHYWIADGLIGKMPSLRAQLDKGHAMLNTLQNSCLLEAVSAEMGESFVKMHDLVRIMALFIATEKPVFMVKAGSQLRELPAEQEWTLELERVSLMRNSISEIPSAASPSCPKLSTLMLQHNPLESLPSSFFTHMQGLKVLNLSCTPIKTLPTSIRKLTNLSALYLEGCCNLSDMPSLGTLNALEVLNLRYASIREVPHGLENLINLRILDLYALRGPERIIAGVIARLLNLQCLRTDHSDIVLDPDELENLKLLETLGARFLSPSDFNRYVNSQHWRGLNNFRLQVGNIKRVKYGIGKEVCIINCSFSGEGEGSLVLPGDIQELHIDSCQGFVSLSHMLSLGVGRYFEGHSLISSEAKCVSSPLKVPNNILSGLGKLTLHNLPDLRDLFGELEPQPDTLYCLRSLNISKCPNVKNLFTPGLVQNLRKLEAIIVDDCQQMEEIIAQESGESHHPNDYVTGIELELPKLRVLELSFLPRLKSIYSGLMVCVSLQFVKIVNCPNLKRLPLIVDGDNGQESLSSSPREIEGQAEWWESLEWERPEAKPVLQPLFREWSPIQAGPKAGGLSEQPPEIL